MKLIIPILAIATLSSSVAAGSLRAADQDHRDLSIWRAHIDSAKKAVDGVVRTAQFSAKDFSNPADYEDDFIPVFDSAFNQIIPINDPYTVDHTGTLELTCEMTGNQVAGSVSYTVSEVTVHAQDWMVNTVKYVGGTMVYQPYLPPSYGGRVAFELDTTVNITIPEISATVSGSFTGTQCANGNAIGPLPLGTMTGTLSYSTIEMDLHTKGRVNVGNDNIFIYAENFAVNAFALDAGAVSGLSFYGIDLSSSMGDTVDQYLVQDIYELVSSTGASELPTKITDVDFWGM